jgi:hypothetical protein
MLRGSSTPPMVDDKTPKRRRRGTRRGRRGMKKVRGCTTRGWR